MTTSDLYQRETTCRLCGADGLDRQLLFSIDSNVHKHDRFIIPIPVLRVC